MNATQELMLEIARKERELEQRLDGWSPPPRERLVIAAPIAVLAGLVACVIGAVCAGIGGSVEDARDPGTLSAIVEKAPAIPWRHFTNGRCHVWVSDLGMAEIFCDGRVVYHGFGLAYDGRFQAQLLHESSRYDHDVARGAEIDQLFATTACYRRVRLGTFSSCRTATCGARTIEELTEVHP